MRANFLPGLMAWLLRRWGMDTSESHRCGALHQTGLSLSQLIRQQRITHYLLRGTRLAALTALTT